jgi:hypothetical protein
LKNATEKSCSAALQFRTPFERFFFSFLSHVHLRPFSFILNPKVVKCLHTFEIQNTANVVAMDETAIYDYSSVRICLNANIPTFLFINRWCKAKKPSLMRGDTDLQALHHGIHLLRSLPRTRKITYFFLPIYCSIK